MGFLAYMFIGAAEMAGGTLLLMMGKDNIKAAKESLSSREVRAEAEEDEDYELNI